MNTHKVSLELKFDRKRNRVKTCPCGKSNRDGKFTPYVGHDDKGYCHSCEKTFLPHVEKDIKPYIPKPEPPASYFQSEIFKASLTRYNTNVFVLFMHERFGIEWTNQVVSRYFIGSTKKGATVFWQIDSLGKIRSGKIIQYDSTGHRLKDVNPVWAHTELKLNGYNLKQCLFGAHLLRGNSKPVAVVESEKTACISSLYFPEYLWLACGGIDGLKTDKMTALKNHAVILFPDVQGFDLWTSRAKELEPILNIKVSDLLERKANQEERAGKLDIADYLLRFKIEDFLKPTEPEQSKQLITPSQRTPDTCDPFAGSDKKLSEPSFETFLGQEIEMHSAGYPASWEIKMPTPLDILGRMASKNSNIDKLIYRLGCEVHNEKFNPMPWDQLQGKPLCMPMLTVEQYRANGWKSK